jgi:hypothetical protein
MHKAEDKQKRCQTNNIKMSIIFQGSIANTKKIKIKKLLNPERVI